MMKLQAPLFGQGLVAMCNQVMGMSSLGTVIYPNKTAMEGFRPEQASFRQRKQIDMTGSECKACKRRRPLGRRCQLPTSRWRGDVKIRISNHISSSSVGTSTRLECLKSNSAKRIDVMLQMLYCSYQVCN